MPLELIEIEKIVASPFLSEARLWFVDQNGGRNYIRVLCKDMNTNELQARKITDVGKHDAHLLTSGLRILDVLIRGDADEETLRHIRKIFNRSSASEGWEVRTLPQGEQKHLVRTSDGIVLTKIFLDINSDEEEYINRLPEMIRFFLGNA